VSFKDFGLNKQILTVIDEIGYKTPTLIQKKAIPYVINRRDMLATAQTGSGKTASFVLPTLQILSRLEIKKHHIKGLILAPTRELVLQIEEVVETFSRYLDLKAVSLYGGVSINAQTEELESDADILIATPGRLKEHIEIENINLSHISLFILDEADRMLDMGFRDEIRDIITLLPKKRQNLLFCATLSRDTAALAKTLLNNPLHVDVDKRNAPSKRVQQCVIPVDQRKKAELLSYMIGSKNWHKVLVFTKTKQSAKILSDHLKLDGLKNALISGDKTQAARLKALEEFKEKKVRVLVATDVASRGIDIEELDYVINYELPDLVEDYIHRVGRTGRAHNEGEAYSLVSEEDVKKLREIEAFIKEKIPRKQFPGYEPHFRIDRVKKKTFKARTTKPRHK
jgi:ATP-dependent RNA helicase RhlE